METKIHSHNFDLLSMVIPPLSTSERVKLVIRFSWKSVRKLAEQLGVSHSSLNACIKSPWKHPATYEKLTDALGFDPWEDK